MRLPRRCLTVITSAMVTATFLATPASAAPAEIPEPPPAAAVRAELAELAEAAPQSMAGYSRARFPHWSSQSSHGRGCDTREVVLARDGSDVTTDIACRAVTGTWFSLYDNKNLSSASLVDIDHMVPLAEGWRSGAWAWDDHRRRQFANDLTNPQLIAVSAASNRSKGDQDPSRWRPPVRESWCLYARAWTHIKHRYTLSITAPERLALGSMLDTCVSA